MNGMILSARKEPFKTMRHAQNAIKNMPGYDVVEKDGGFVGVKKCSGQVVCPSCGLSHYDITDKYNPTEDANASMLSLKEPYLSWGWEAVQQDPDSGYGCLVCPECNSALAPSGKLRVE